MHVPVSVLPVNKNKLRTTIEMRVAHCMAVNISVRVHGPGTYD